MSENSGFKTLPKFTKIIVGKYNKKQEIKKETDEHSQISSIQIKTIINYEKSEIVVDNIDKFPHLCTHCYFEGPLGPPTFDVSKRILIL